MNDKKSLLNERIFGENELRKSDFILKNKYAKLSDLISKDIKELAIVWCYYSGKIEGNTYTYVETEALLKDGITSEKRYEDARMLKNLYNTFISEIDYINNKKQTEFIEERTLFRIHKSITADLVSSEECGTLRNRQVRITGTDYIPPKDIQEIQRELSVIFYKQAEFDNPLERAVYLHCNLAKLQPFIDGNKRTARMMESIVMMNAGLIPVYSIKEKDFKNYRAALISFYETQNYTLYCEFFLNRIIERINEISMPNEPTFDLANNREKNNSQGMSM